MTPLKLSDELAKKLYPTAPPEWKAVLVDSFGEPFFKERKPWNQILTLEDVFEATGADPSDPKYNIGDADTIGYELAKLLPPALNPLGWIANWNDLNQRKWQPGFYLNHPGFRFDVSLYSYSYSISSGGSRLRFASEEISDHAGKQFQDNIYKKFMV